MNEREELASTIGEQFEHPAGPNCPTCADAYRAADAILAAGYRKPRQITTVEELDALPLDSVILDADDMTLQLDYILNDPSIKFWSQPGSEDRHGNGYVTLPATVLWEPLP